MEMAERAAEETRPLVSARVIIAWFMQWFHIVGAALVGGGAILFSIIFTPAVREFLPAESQDVMREEVATRIAILFAVGMLLVSTTGLYNFFFQTPQIRSLGDLVTTNYGKILLAHVGAALAVSTIYLVMMVLHFTDVIDDILPFTIAGIVLGSLAVGLGALLRRV